MRTQDIRVATPTAVMAGWILALSLSLVGAPGTAHATGETLKRATGNILMAPFDMVLAPVVAGKTIVTNMREIEDTTAVRVAYAVPGYVFLTGVQLGAATIRAISGVLEFVPGLGLVFFDTDLDPLYDPVERGEGLVDYDTRFMRFKFGIDYTGASAY